jgi:hypothetical protein
MTFSCSCDPRRWGEVPETGISQRRSPSRRAIAVLVAARPAFPGWGRAAALGAVQHRHLPRLPQRCAWSAQRGTGIFYGRCRVLLAGWRIGSQFPSGLGSGGCWAWPTTECPRRARPDLVLDTSGQAG